MPRFPVAFGKRKSTADFDAEVLAPVSSFRVLERPEVVSGRSFDGGASLTAKTHQLPKTSLEDVEGTENIFAGLKPKYNNRGSGLSNITNTNSTDSSSRHSNASTAPSSTDVTNQDELRVGKRGAGDKPMPQAPKSAPSGFRRQSARSWSFGGPKKPVVAVEEFQSTPASPSEHRLLDNVSTPPSTKSTAKTAPTSPFLDDAYTLDLGGSFSSLMLGFDKRPSVSTVKDENNTPVNQSPSQPLERNKQPPPILIDRSSKIETSPFSWGSRASRENLLTASPTIATPDQEIPPPVPSHGSISSGRPLTAKRPSMENLLKRTSMIFGRRKSTTSIDLDKEDATLLRDSIMAAEKLKTGGDKKKPPSSSGRYRRNEAQSPTVIPAPAAPVPQARPQPRAGDRPVSMMPILRSPSPTEKRTRFETSKSDENLFETGRVDTSRFARASPAPSPVLRKPANPSPARVMTPSQFEQFRKEKEAEARRVNFEKAQSPLPNNNEDDDEDEPNYDDDEDELERSREAAKQRRKQEAHMSVYRQQMMKVTGEPANVHAQRSSIQLSLNVPGAAETNRSTSPDSEEDEEVPLAILAAHGFPNKNKAPARLAKMSSNPNMRHVAQPSYQRPGSVVGTEAPGGGRRLPVFARNLPQDPYGLVNPSVRESFALGGGAPVNAGALPPGGLIGVIASEERSRALRRGSPQVPTTVDNGYGMPQVGTGGFDPVQGIPPQMMYPYGMQMSNGQMMPNDPAQAQMAAQMNQFMQMQMQFMQMMTANNNGQRPPSSAGHGASQSMALPSGMSVMGSGGDPRASFYGQPAASTLNVPGGNMHNRAMSMVQPMSGPWSQPQMPQGYTPGMLSPMPGYAPSIAPSERSNVGLPGRYRPVSQSANQPHMDRTQSAPLVTAPYSPASETSSATPRAPTRNTIRPVVQEAEEDEDEGWAAMKAKRDQKKMTWRSRKSVAPSELGALIS